MIKKREVAMGNAILSLNLDRINIQTKKPQAYRKKPSKNFGPKKIFNIFSAYKGFSDIAIFKIIKPLPLKIA
jgi:hypothetical protein